MTVRRLNMWSHTRIKTDGLFPLSHTNQLTLPLSVWVCVCICVCVLKTLLCFKALLYCYSTQSFNISLYSVYLKNNFFCILCLNKFDQLILNYGEKKVDLASGFWLRGIVCPQKSFDSGQDGRKSSSGCKKHCHPGNSTLPIPCPCHCILVLIYFYLH